MGSSESKQVASGPQKPEAPVKNSRVGDLMDPRSPSTGIDRTPIQVCGRVSKLECPLAFTDPRSPTIGICRTPVREVMRATVGSFARRLGLLLHNETEGKVPEAPPKNFNDAVEEEEDREELASTEPLLPTHALSSLAEHANLLVTPVRPTCQSVGEVSPFMLLEQPKVEVELETEADISLEEAEEARESPLHKRLSMSLITCHEGATSQIFAEVHRDSSSSPVPNAEEEPGSYGVDHCYALPSITVNSPTEPSLPTDASPAQVSPAPVSEQAESSSEEPKEQLEEISPALASEQVESSSEEPKEQLEECSPAPVSEQAEPSSGEPKDHLDECSPAPEPPAVPSQEQTQLSSGIRCPTFDPKSPSQVVFKPQWLGKGFGTAGRRARGVRGGKGGSSPLAVRVAVKKVTNENRRQSGKLKQNGTEGRSPLQLIKGTNSPRDQRSQMKLKVSTPDKQRVGQIDRRVLAVCLDKENR